jgi:UDP-GlcNAc:undecaprenyl-phosphate GlcNAc-1-phosphate transferase
LFDQLGHQRAVLTLYGVGLALALIGLFSITLNVQEAGLLLFALLLAGFVGIGRLGYEELGVIRSGFVLRFYDAPVLHRSLFVVFLELLFVALATYAAIVLKYDDWSLLQHRRLAVAMGATLAPITVTVMWLLGVYRGSWRLASAYEATRICLAVLVATAAAFIVMRPVSGEAAPLSLFFVYALAKLAIATGSRLSYRMLADGRSRAARTGTRVLIYGAGAGGSKAVREMLYNPAAGMQPVAFIDDNPDRAGRSLNSFRILGPVERLEEYLRSTAAEAVVLSTTQIPAERVELARAICERAGVKLLRMDIRFDECDRPAGAVAGPEPSGAAIGPAVS